MSSEICVAHEGSVHGARGGFTLRNGPHHERLAAAHVAGHEDAICAGGIAVRLGGHVAARAERRAEGLRGVGFTAQKTGRDERQPGGDLLLAEIGRASCRERV